MRNSTQTETMTIPQSILRACSRDECERVLARSEGSRSSRPVWRRRKKKIVCAPCTMRVHSILHMRHCAGELFLVICSQNRVSILYVRLATVGAVLLPMPHSRSFRPTRVEHSPAVHRTIYHIKISRQACTALPPHIRERERTRARPGPMMQHVHTTHTHSHFVLNICKLLKHISTLRNIYTHARASDVQK